MAKNKNESNNKNSGTLLTKKDGTQYSVMGKVRIKVSEHFAQDGKPLDSLLEDVIQHAAASTLPPLPEKIRNNDCQSAHAYDILVPASIV